MSKEPKKALEYALRLLGQRAYSEKKLKDKLLSKEFEIDQVESTLARLKELDLINDRKFTVDFIDSRQRINLQGKRKIYWSLIKKGISGEIADDVLESVYDKDLEEVSIRELIVKYSKGVPQDKLYQKLMRKLVSKGFNYSLAKDEIINFMAKSGS